MYWECFSENEIHYQCVKIDQQRGIFLLQRILLRHKLCTQKMFDYVQYLVFILSNSTSICRIYYGNIKSTNFFYLYECNDISLSGKVERLWVSPSYFNHTAKPYEQLKLVYILLPSTCKLHLLQNFLFPMSNTKICLIIIENKHSSYTRNQLYNGHVNKKFMYWEEISICATTDPKILSNNLCGPRPMRNEQLAKFQTWGLRHVLSCLNNKKRSQGQLATQEYVCEKSWGTVQW